MDMAEKDATEVEILLQCYVFFLMIRLILRLIAPVSFFVQFFYILCVIFLLPRTT